MSFPIGSLVANGNNVYSVSDVVYICRSADAQMYEFRQSSLRAATTEDIAALAVKKKEIVDKKIAELLAYRKQLEDGVIN